ncbi:PUB domain protein [Phytophthora megakarya]|uniref:PUB domain protein n=1 Tax=Phytophthora megakarya TaxID=4795 RepID=A0A225VUW9_9STRA|nr:PUB domain protein [Phytophthora megakarya]
MDWLKKKKEAAQQVAAKISNKRTAFRGEGNVLGGGDASSSAAVDPPVSSRLPSVKLPFTSNKLSALSAEEQQKRRELQAKALEQRGNAWGKRVATARKARQQQEEDHEKKFQYAAPPPSSDAAALAGPPPIVLSNDQVKVRELQSAHQQMGFNPYEATFSSSTQAVSAMNAIITYSDGDSNGAVYVLLRQDAALAMTAAETLIKMLTNVVKNPQDEKFRKIRLSNGAVQTKLVVVPGAVDILAEAGFLRAEIDGEVYLMLTAGLFQAERVQSAIDRTEVALIQLQHGFA